MKLLLQALCRLHARESTSQDYDLFPLLGNRRNAYSFGTKDIGLRRASRADGVGDADSHTEDDAGVRVAKAQRQRSASSSSREHP